MDYQKIYSSLVKKRQQSPPLEGYCENHHILPKSLGGKNNKENRVKLTAKEHYIAHRLLAKIHGGPMWAALFAMSVRSELTKERYILSAQAYSTAREGHSKHRAKAMVGEKNHFYGRVHSGKTKTKISEAKTGVPLVESARLALIGKWAGDKNPRYGKGDERAGENNPFYGKNHSAETIGKMSEAAKKRESHPMRGKSHSEESRRKISKNWNKTESVCPHCQKKGESRAMKRWHFDNCKVANVI